MQKAFQVGPKPHIDHFILRVSGNLQEYCSHFQQISGVKPCVGGRHPDRGTWNALVALQDDMYLEFMAKDPKQTHPKSPWLGFEKPDPPSSRMLTWVVRYPSLKTAYEQAKAHRTQYELKPIEHHQRFNTKGELLKWSLSINHFGHELPGDGLIPFLVEWSTQELHPAKTSPKGCSVLDFRLIHPNPERIIPIFNQLGIRTLQIQPGDSPSLALILNTPKGEIELN